MLNNAISKSNAKHADNGASPPLEEKLRNLPLQTIGNNRWFDILFKDANLTRRRARCLELQNLQLHDSNDENACQCDYAYFENWT